MQWENLFYALAQLVHNFGAVAVVAGALCGLKVQAENLALKQKLAWLVFFGWIAQACSGLMFGAISFFYYGETPDLHSTAEVAFIIKVTCAAAAGSLALFYIKRAKDWTGKGRCKVWCALTVFGVIALTAAAFLRWFS